jgi:prepilin-type N-terminal cleavage/methylation domain-containing protein
MAQATSGERTVSTRKTGRAFTLIEVLLSVALFAILMFALNSFIFSMADIWGRGGERRLFELHARTVTRELEALLRQASLRHDTDRPVIFGREIVQTDGVRMALLSFELPAGYRRLRWDGPPLPDVICALSVQQGRGLGLYWQSRLEKDFEDARPRYQPLSGLAIELKYEYQDFGRTSSRESVFLQRDATGAWMPPTRLKLTFSQGGMVTETVVQIPETAAGLPLF